MPVAETIAIGTELLLGEIQDTNTRYLACQLRSVGIDFYRATIIGDNPVRIAQAIKDAASRSDIVITSGGLGPTVDDPTREAAALAAGVELEFREDLWVEIQERFQRYGRKPTENNRRQAYVPLHATGISNPVGTAPAFSIEINGCIVICLPGVPRELETLLEISVFPILKKRFQLKSVLKSVVLHAAGIGESQIDEWISDLESGANPTVGLLAHPGITDIRITARADSDIEASRMLQVLRDEIIQRIGESYFGDDAVTLEQNVDQLLAEKNWRALILVHGFGEGLESRINELGTKRILLSNAAEETHPSPELEIVSANDYEIIIRADLFPGQSQTNLSITFSSPDGHQTVNRSHGGHPGLAQLWAENLVLDLIRRYLYNKTKHKVEKGKNENS
jgi:competence/damage-inducible protein CinA-like protein